MAGRLTGNKRRWLLLGAFVLFVAYVLFLQRGYYYAIMNSDWAGHILSGLTALREGRLLARGYSYTSTLAFESNLLLVPLFYRIVPHVRFAVTAANVSLLAVYWLLLYALLRTCAVQRAAAAVAASMLMLPCNSILETDAYFIEQFYLLQLIGVVFTLYLVNKAGGGKKDWLLCAGCALMSFLQALNGTRYVALAGAPALFLLLYRLYRCAAARAAGQRPSPALRAGTAVLVCNAAGLASGYLVYTRVLAERYSTYGNTMDTQLLDDGGAQLLERLPKILLSILQYAGFLPGGQDMLSFDGITMLLCLGVAVVLLGLMLCGGTLLRDTSDETLPTLYVYALGSLLANAAFSALLKGGNIVSRYASFFYAPAMVLAWVYFYRRWKAKKLLSSFVQCLAVAVLAAAFACSQLSILKEAILYNRTDGMLAGSVQALRNDVNAWLLDNGYTFGYAGYWQSNVGTVTSDMQLEYAALKEGADGIEPWLGGVPRRYFVNGYHTGKTFVVMTPDYDISYYLTEAGGEVVYQNGYFTVWSYLENPFYFTDDLLGNFPVCGERLTFTPTELAADGALLTNGELRKNSDADGALSAGPVFTLNHEGTFTLEFALTVHDAGAGSPGTVSVVTQEGTVLASADIPAGTGPQILRLENVFIPKQEPIAGFPVTTRAGTDVSLASVTVERTA